MLNETFEPLLQPENKYYKYIIIKNKQKKKNKKIHNFKSIHSLIYS